MEMKIGTERTFVTFGYIMADSVKKSTDHSLPPTDLPKPGTSKTAFGQVIIKKEFE